MVQRAADWILGPEEKQGACAYVGGDFLGVFGSSSFPCGGGASGYLQGGAKGAEGGVRGMLLWCCCWVVTLKRDGLVFFVYNGEDML